MKVTIDDQEYVKKPLTISTNIHGERLGDLF